jgi:Abortive infection alpha
VEQDSDASRKPGSTAAIELEGSGRMAEENKTRDVVDAVTGLVKTVPVYEDALQPAAREIGAALQTVAKSVHIALAPVSVLVWGYDQIREFVNSKVAERLRHVPPERIVSPKPHVAVPVIEALRYTGSEPLLSDMYANLLASAMDKSTARGVHPSFVEIIRQLTPDEAKLVSLFVRDIQFPLVTVRSSDVLQKGAYIDMLENYSHLGRIAGCEYAEMTPEYLGNICRLGLAEIPMYISIPDNGVYKSLESAPIVVDLMEKINAETGRVAEIERGGLFVTQFGRQFGRICVSNNSMSDDSGLGGA